MNTQTPSSSPIEETAKDTSVPTQTPNKYKVSWLPGVTLTITRSDAAPVLLSDGTAATTTAVTNANGAYSFTNLETLPSGTHYIVTVTAPVGYISTVTGSGTTATDSSTGTATSTDLTADGASDTTLDFGFVKPMVSVGDYVWVDTNRDGIQDSGELGIPGVTVTLTDNAGNPVTDVYGNAVTPKVTDANGAYAFTGLPEGAYTVTVTTPTGYIATLTGAGTTSTDSSTGTATSVALTGNGASDTTLDFGFVVPMVSVGDFVWSDANYNGVQDDGEPGIAGITLTLTTAAGDPVTDVYGNVVGPIVTDANGAYSFTGLPEGTYNVAVTAPVGYVTSPTGAGTPDTDSSVGSVDSLTLVGNGSSDVSLDFGFFKPTPGLTVIKYDTASGITEGDRNDVDHAIKLTTDTTEISFKITNTGDSLLTDVTLTDVTVSGTGTVTNITCPDTIKDGLTPGETVICTGTLSGMTEGTNHYDEATVTAKSLTGDLLVGKDPWFASRVVSGGAGGGGIDSGNSVAGVNWLLVLFGLGLLGTSVAVGLKTRRRYEN